MEGDPRGKGKTVWKNIELYRGYDQSDLRDSLKGLLQNPVKYIADLKETYDSI